MRNNLDPALPGPHSDEAVVTHEPAAGKREDEAGLVLCLWSTEAAPVFLRMKDKNYQ